VSLWQAADAARATGGKATGAWSASGVGIDSRSLVPGDLFVALKGTRDGHAFVKAAFEAGAAAALVARTTPPVPAQVPLLVVEDTQTGLEALGRAGRARSAATVVAITGSVGKTGTKEALRHVLAQQGATFASTASHNNHWGVPLSLARLPQDARWAVLELGMNHAGEIRALTAQARPHVAVITRIAAAHLANFRDEAAIADAKAEIFEGVEPGGTAVIPADGPHASRLHAHAHAAGIARIVTFGSAPGADWRLTDWAGDATSSRGTVEHGGDRLSLELPLAGAHQAMNAVAVLAAVAAAGGDPERAAAALATLAAPPGRGVRHRIRVGGGTALLLDESYNANPASMAAAIAVLGSQPGRRIAVLGDMLELGPQGPELHARLAADLMAADAALLFACGAQMRRLYEAVPPDRRGAHVMDSMDLLPYLRASLEPGDVILVKGSLGSRMGPVVKQLLGETTAPAGEPGIRSS
jgi:UDP-N-acetylmuramoyl-tripeptide--D-alanyl-D-alanine ligase